MRPIEFASNSIVVAELDCVRQHISVREVAKVIIELEIRGGNDTLNYTSAEGSNERR